LRVDGALVRLRPSPPGDGTRGPVTLVDAFSPRHEGSKGTALVLELDRVSLRDVDLDAAYRDVRVRGLSIERGAFRLDGESVVGSGDLSTHASSFRENGREIGPLFVSIDGASWDVSTTSPHAEFRARRALVEGVLGELEVSGTVQRAPWKADVHGSLSLSF